MPMFFIIILLTFRSMTVGSKGVMGWWFLQFMWNWAEKQENVWRMLEKSLSLHSKLGYYGKNIGEKNDEHCYRRWTGVRSEGDYGSASKREVPLSRGLFWCHSRCCESYGKGEETLDGARLQAVDLIDYRMILYNDTHFSWCFEQGTARIILLYKYRGWEGLALYILANKGYVTDMGSYVRRIEQAVRKALAWLCWDLHEFWTKCIYSESSLQPLALFTFQLNTLFSSKLITRFTSHLNTLFSTKLITRFSCHLPAPFSLVPRPVQNIK